MYKFYCGYIKTKYGSKPRKLHTDTDSLMYEIKLKIFLIRIRKCLILVIIQLFEKIWFSN